MRLTARLAATLTLAIAASLDPAHCFARARQEKLPDSSRLVLDNGFTAILIPNRSAPLVTSVIVVGAGSSHETSASSGISHMLEHLLFDGTKRRTQEQIASEMDRLGIVNNAHTGTDDTAYFVMATREHFGQAIDLQADMLFESTIPEDRLAREREIIANEIAKDQVGDEAAISALFASRFFQGTGLALPVTGTPESVRSLPRQEIEAWYHAWYVPNNMTAVIMGDFDDAEMEPLVRRYFGRAAPGLLPGPSPATRDAAGDKRAKVSSPALGRTHTRRTESARRLIWMGAPAPAIGSAGYDAASMLAALLGTDLARAVNDRLAAAGKGGALGMLTEAGVSLDAHAAASAFQVRAALDEKVSFEDAGKALSGEISARLSANPWKSADLDRIRLSERAALLRLWEKPHYFGLDRAPDIAAAGWDFARDRVKRLSWVEPSDLEALAKRLAPPAGWATFMTGAGPPADEGGAGMDGTARGPRSAEEEAASASPRTSAGSRDLVSRWKGAEAPAASDAPATLPARTGAVDRSDASGDRASNVRTALPNGLQIAMDYSEDSRVFAAHVLIKNRSASEPAGKGGIVELLHRLAGSGTKDHPGASLDAALESIGGTLKVVDDASIPYDDIYLSPEYSYVRLEALDEFAPRALDLLREIITEPLIEDGPRLEMARDQALARARQSAVSPKERCRMLLARGIWGDSHPFAAPLFGTEADLKSITPDDLRAFHAVYFNPRNIIVGVGTSIRPDVMLPMLEAKLGRRAPDSKLSSRTPGPIGAKATAGAMGGPDRFLNERLEAPQAWLMWGRLTVQVRPGDEAADRETMRAVASVLSRRMVDVLREKKGLSYSAGAEAIQLGGRTQLTASMGFLPGQETAARQAFREVLTSLSDSPPSAQEVEQAVGSSEVRGLMRSLSRINRAWSRCLAQLSPVPPSTDASAASIRTATTPERVAEAARGLGSPADPSAGWYEALVSPAPEAEPTPPETSGITGKALMEHVKALAGLQGQQAAADYIERFFRAQGLRPGSEAGPFLEDYRHSFSLARIAESGVSEIHVDRPSGQRVFPARLFPFAPPERSPEGQEEAGESIFLDAEDLAAMAGVTSPPRFEGGTVVTVERRDSAQAADPAALLAGQVVGSSRMGAAALVVIRSASEPSVPAVYEALLSDPRDGAQRLPLPCLPPELLVLSAGPELGAELMGQRLFMRHTESPITAPEPAFRPIPLDLALTLSSAAKVERTSMLNVVGVARGRDPSMAGEAVLVTAPYADAGDVSGVAALFEIARLLAGGSTSRTPRSLIFAATDGGESGLAGSRALAGRLSDMSIRPTSVVSLAALGAPLQVSTSQPSRLREITREMAAKLDVTLESEADLESAEEQGRRFPFYLAGVPSIGITAAVQPSVQNDAQAIEKAARLAALIVWALAR